MGFGFGMKVGFAMFLNPVRPEDLLVEILLAEAQPAPISIDVLRTLQAIALGKVIPRFLLFLFAQACLFHGFIHHLPFHQSAQQVVAPQQGEGVGVESFDGDGHRGTVSIGFWLFHEHTPRSQ